MPKLIPFLALLLLCNFGFTQSSTKQIDSLISLAKASNNVDSSARLLQTAYTDAQKIDYKNGMASYFLVQGVNLYNQNKFDEALKLTFEGEKLILGTKDNAKISHMLALRGNCLNNLFFFEESKKCLNDAKFYANKIKDDETRYFSLGRIYRIMAANFRKNPKNRILDSALYYQKKSFEIQSKIKKKGLNQSGNIIQAAAIGIIYAEMGKIDSATYYFNKGIALADQQKLSKYKVESLIGLGEISYSQEKYSDALKYFLDAASIVKSTQNSGNTKSIYKALAQTYEMLGEDKLSIANYKKYGFMADSMMLANKDAITAPTNHLLKERDQLIKTESQLRNLYLIFAACIFIASITIFAILYRNNKRSNKHNKALDKANKQIIAQNQYLHETLEALEQSNEENNRMMQIIAHDLRSPMAAIVGLSEFMLHEHALAEEDKEVIGLINSSGKDSLTFISQILENEANESALKTQPVDIFALLNYCTIQLQYKASDKKQKILLSGSTLTVHINREKIWRVISNLITNAIKFSPEGAEILVDLKVIDGNAVISVKDNGIGIPTSLKDKIFNASEESKREGTNGEKSFGLGLAISQQIVEAHWGKLTFKSEKDLGTTFFVALPLA